MPESIDALHRANPRAEAGLAGTIDAVGAEVRLRISAAGARDEPRVGHVRLGRRLLGVSAAGLALAAAVVAVFVSFDSSSVTPGVENAAAAIKQAATLTAASAEHSGTVDVRITHGGQLWASKIIRWNGDDLEINDLSRKPSSGSPLLVVNGLLYGHDPQHGGWVQVGPVSNIDPGSGTTPTEQLDAIREDVGGTTLQRMVAGMSANGLTTKNQSDGSTVYSGTVAAGQIARETGFKEGQTIRVFPFGYVAQGAAAHAASRLDTAVTVAAGGVIRRLAVSWGTWTYTVAYSSLGSTPRIVAPAHATSLLKERMRAVHER